MLFVDRVPAPPLNAFIASLWYCENDPQPLAFERVLPSGAAQLIVNLKEDQTRVYRLAGTQLSVSTAPGAVLSGVSSRYGIIDSAETEQVAGVALRPGGMAAFFAGPAHETADEDVPLEFLWGSSRTAELRERLLAAPTPEKKLDVLESTMVSACKSSSLHPVVLYALDMFGRSETTAAVADVANQTGLSSKCFLERFKTTVGMPPKQYCRLLRFQRALTCAEGGRQVEWTRVAMDCGYFDQAHFIHDFRAFAGITPSVYEAGRTQFRNHVKFLQSAILAEMG